jgi:hypothetical protein
VFFQSKSMQFTRWHAHAAVAFLDHRCPRIPLDRSHPRKNEDKGKKKTAGFQF